MRGNLRNNSAGCRYKPQHAGWKPAVRGCENQIVLGMALSGS